MLSRVDRVFSRVRLSATDTRESSSAPTTDPVPPFYTAPPTNRSIEENTGHDRLVKYQQQFFTDVKGIKIITRLSGFNDGEEELFQSIASVFESSLNLPSSIMTFLITLLVCVINLQIKVDAVFHIFN